MKEIYTRRHFLGMLAAGGAMIVSGCLPRKGSHVTKETGKGFLRFVFYTDIHARTEWTTPVALGRAAIAINEQRPDLVIAGGDLITDGFQSSADTVAPRWDAYMEMHHAIDHDIYPVMGNHDMVAAIPEDGTLPSEDPRVIYRNKMGIERTYYSFDAVGYHFVVLDSIHITGGRFKYHGFIWPEQLEWLRDDLSRVPKGTGIILATHVPILTAFYSATLGSTIPAPKNRVMVNNKDVLNLFEDHNLILVLQGHLHIKEMLRWRNATFITGGAICGKWWRGTWMDTGEGFCVITLKGDRVEWEYVEYEWEARRPIDQ
jgi:3',5'-cyclic AMP phosphodiesterase CpdA